MNIFVLSFNTKDAAQQHCDKHVIKMILETTQLLYMCWCICGNNDWRTKLENELENNETLLNMQNNNQKVNFKTYKCGKGHLNHPCSKWVRESVDNYKWLCSLGLELCKEKMHRWPKNKQHTCLGHLEVLCKNIPDNIPKLEMTKFATAMPDKYKENCVVTSYKTYYNEDKQNLFKWTNRTTPCWIIT